VKGVARCGEGRGQEAAGTAGTLIYYDHPVTRPVLHGAIFLADRLSRSRPPRLMVAPLQSRRMRSASPNLDPASTCQGSAPIEEDGETSNPAMAAGPRPDPYNIYPALGEASLPGG